jgi:hypothetical protein
MGGIWLWMGKCKRTLVGDFIAMACLAGEGVVSWYEVEGCHFIGRLVEDYKKWTMRGRLSSWLTLLRGEVVFVPASSVMMLMVVDEKQH